MSGLSPKVLAKQLLTILARDQERLTVLDEYVRGEHQDPYMPAQADAEYRLLAKRCVNNWMPLLISTPAQSLYVDAFRKGDVKSDPTNPSKPASIDSPEWDHWKRSRLDARQIAVHRGALKHGHSFTLTEKVPGKGVRTKGLSAMRTAAVFEDAANDDTPYAALTVTRLPHGDTKGKARMFDGLLEYAVTFTSLSSEPEVTIGATKRHGASECPITRFAAAVDLEGRTVGVVEPMMSLQDRINQTIFDLLVAQTYGSFKVRTVTGMAPPLQRDPETGEPILDEHGNPQPIPVNHNAKRIMFAEDPEVKFGSLDETPLSGYIESVDMSVRHLSAISQTPPHYLLGQIANLSADALNAAETALQRKIAEFRQSFGESWERVFRLAGEMLGTASADDFHGEVVWRDMEQKSMAQTSDALGKLSQNLKIPAQGLWSRVPGVTQTELQHWTDLAENDPQAKMADAMNRATSGLHPDVNRQPNSFGNRAPAEPASAG